MFFPPVGGMEKGPAYQGYRYYKAEETKEQQPKNMDGVFYHLELLKMSIEASKHPDGAQARPAKTCKDLTNCYDGVKTGDYWIDPNGGCNMDAFQATCNYTNMVAPETCIAPSKTTFAKKNIHDVVSITSGQNAWVWFLQELDTEAKFDYVADTVQLRYMRMNSVTVKQNITFHCKNVHAHKNTKGAGKKFVKVLGYDDFKLHTRQHHKKNRLDVLEDGCQKPDGEWHKTVFQYTTNSLLDRLPIQDIAVYFDDEQMQNKDLEFSIELGPVCFS